MTEAVEPSFDPVKLLAALFERDVAFVVVGGVAARLQGWPGFTRDLDIAPEQSAENLGRLADALRDLDARLTVSEGDEALRVPLDARTFSSPVMDFETDHGEIGVLREVIGLGGYADLETHSVVFDLGDGVTVVAASLDDVIASKEAAGRAKDLAHLPSLYAARDELTRRQGPDLEHGEDGIDLGR